MLIRTLALIEVSIFVLYLVATPAPLDTIKYELYAKLFLARLMSYQTLKLFLVSGAQLVITIYAFLRWYYESYSIKPGAIIYRSGVFFKKERVVPLERHATTTLSFGPLGKLLHYGTIRVKDGARREEVALADISRPQELIRTIGQCMSEQTSAQKLPDLGHLLRSEEDETLEFKSSLRFDHRTASINHELEKTAIKTIAAFLNSRGGSLVIGVDDTRKPIGVACDYQTLKRQNSDGFENHFTQIFNTMVGPEFRHLVKLSFHQTDGKELCVVGVTPSPRPAYLRLGNQEHFYVRTGNGTTSLTFSKAEAYSRSRWPVEEA